MDWIRKPSNSYIIALTTPAMIMTVFGDRGIFVVVFNVLFVGGDYGAFEDLERIRILLGIKDPVDTIGSEVIVQT